MENKAEKQKQIPAVIEIQGTDLKNLFDDEHEFREFKSLQLALIDDSKKLNVVEQYCGFRDFDSKYIIDQEDNEFKNKLPLDKLKWTSKVIRVFDSSVEEKILDGLPTFPNELVNLVKKSIDELQTSDPIETRKWAFLKEIAENHQDLLENYGVEIVKNQHEDEYSIALLDRQLNLLFYCMHVSDTFTGYIFCGSVFDDNPDYESNKGDKFHEAYKILQTIFEKVCLCDVDCFDYINCVENPDNYNNNDNNDESDHINFCTSMYRQAMLDLDNNDRFRQ